MFDSVQCPFCGEQVELADVDESAPGVQEFVQDCDVCCNPISLRVVVLDNGDLDVQASR